MRALTVIPGRSGSAGVEDLPEPAPEDGPVLVRGVAAGICGTDIEITQGMYGAAPAGRDRLVLGHESLGEVIEAPAGSGLAPGDAVVGIVRHPDPVPCSSCAAGEWDMCENGRYTEHGIKERDGFMAERWRAEPAFLVKVARELGITGVLLEPASVVAKAWDHVWRIAGRSAWRPRRALVTGAGPVGLLAALAAVQHGLEVQVLDRNTDGPKPRLAADLGAGYHSTGLQDVAREADVIVECTGAAPVILGAIAAARPNAIVCLTGVSSGGHLVPLDVGELNRALVLENNVVFGSVNANRAHYEMGAAMLARADRGWLERLITRRVPLDRWAEALERRPGDVKTVLTLA